MNEGLDFGCAVGEEVVAVAEGHSIVEAVGKLEGPGLQEVGRVPDEVQVEERLEEYTVAGMRHFEVDMGDMSPEEGASVDLADALLKALRRRAEALEGREKWDLAQKDWETIINCTWSSKMRSDAQTGANRCRKMLSAERDPRKSFSLIEIS